MVDTCSQYPTQVFSRVYSDKVQTRGHRVIKVQSDPVSGTPPLPSGLSNVKVPIIDVAHNLNVMAAQNNTPFVHQAALLKAITQTPLMD